MKESHNIFSPKTNVQLNTLIMSDAVTFASDGTITKVSSNVKFYKNSIEQISNSFGFSVGDKIQLSITSPNLYGDQEFGVVTVGLTSGETTNQVFTVVTIPDVKEYMPFAGLEPFELTESSDGSPYYPNKSDNKLTKFENLDDETPEATISLASSTTLQPLSEEVDSVVICSYFDRKIHKINIETSEIYANIQLSGKPYGAIAVPVSPGGNYLTNLWVTIADEDRVVVIDNTNSIIGEYPTGQRPLGIAIDSSLENVWVANNSDNTVTHFSWDYDNTIWNSSSVVVGNKPYEIACDIDGNAWVTCAGDNKVYRITKDNIATYYEIGENPRGIAYSNFKMWIAVSYDRKLVAVDLDGNIVNEITNIGIHPFSVGALPIPVIMRSKLSEIINILDELRYDSLSDSLALLERINTYSASDAISISDSLRGGDRVSDSVSVSDGVALNRISDSFSISDSLSVTFTPAEPPADTTKDALYNYVVLHVNGEAPTR